MTRSSRLLLSLGLGVLTLGLPLMALAHSPYPGVRGFYVGALHPLTTPAHVLLIVAVSILLGSQVREGRMRFLVTVFTATAAGMVLAFVLSAFLPSALMILVLTTIIGALLILPRTLPGWLLMALAGLSGFLLAMESIPDPGAFLDVLITVFGSLVGIHYLIMYGSRGARYVLDRWDSRVTHLGFRVAGSWISAIGVLMLAFSLSGP